MALADKALYGIESAADLWDMNIPDGDDALRLRWKDEALQLPILRNATKADGVTNEPLPQATFERILKSVLKLSGYFGTATIHAIRRSLGKKLDGKWPRAQMTQTCVSLNDDWYRAVYRSPEVPAYQPEGSSRLRSGLRGEYFFRRWKESIYGRRGTTRPH